MYIIRIIGIIILESLCLFSMAQDSLANQKAIQLQQRATYIYNFTKYIEWDNLEDRESFTIGVFNKEEEQLVKVLRAAYANKTIKGKPIEVIHFISQAEITPTDIMYLKANSGVDLDRLLPTMYRNHTLLIGEGYPFRKSMVNFIELNGEFHFEISKEKINKAELLVDPALLNFSIQSTADWQLVYDRLQKEISVVESQKVELEKLENEIQNQENELKIQQDKLRVTLVDVELKQQMLIFQDSTIQSKNSEISAQLNSLEKLKKNVQDQLLINIERSKVFEEQEKGIALQGQKIMEQDQILLERKQEIEIQEGEIINQKEEIIDQKKEMSDQQKKLNRQFSQLEEQRLALYAFLVLMGFAVIFIFFMLRSNRRRKVSERNLFLKNAELRLLNDSLDSFTYRVSHDLKAPVLNIKNMVSMLEEHTKTVENPIVPEIILNLSLSSNRLGSTIVDLLQLTRIERIDEVKSMIRLPDLLEGLLPDFEGELKLINGDIDIKFLGHEEIYASDIELLSVFQNLITNSIKYRSVNHPLLIQISSKYDSSNFTLIYKDNGKGIDLKKYDGKLFSMFERFTSDKSISGTGVGMYIIKKLVEKNNGIIEVESELNKGLSYTIVFPFRPQN